MPAAYKWPRHFIGQRTFRRCHKHDAPGNDLNATVGKISRRRREGIISTSTALAVSHVQIFVYSGVYAEVYVLELLWNQ